MAVNIKVKNSPQEDKANHALLNILLTSPSDQAMLKAIAVTGNPVYKVGFYSVTVHYLLNNVPASKAVNLPCSTTTILKGIADAGQLILSGNVLRQMLQEVYTELKKANTLFPPEEEQKDITYSVELDGAKIGTADKVVFKKYVPNFQQIPKDGPSIIPEPPTADEPKLAFPKKKPTKTPIKLRDSTVIGQPVHGTSAGSIYYTAAVSKRVRLAVRVKDATVSVRVEGFPDVEEQARMGQLGMSKGNGYWSMHMSCNDVPVARVVGALLMGLGIEFDSMITSLKELQA